MGAAMGHACAHTWATREQQWGMHARIYRLHGSSNRACIRAYIAIYGGSNGACMRAYMASPIGRVEIGNNR